MDSETFGNVMCGLGLFRERAKAAPAERTPCADAEDGDGAAADELIEDNDAGDEDDDDDDDAGVAPGQPRAPA